MRPCHNRVWAEDTLHEECGVFGMYAAAGEDIAEPMFYGLFSLQHRGQESAGIAIANGEQVYYQRDTGLVMNVFTPERMRKLAGGHIGIGHVRYSTTGDDPSANVQPLVVKYRKGSMALAHNGSLINTKKLREELEQQGAVFQTNVDTEIIANMLARSGEDRLEEGLRNLAANLQGSYAIVLLTDHQLIGMRDPHGIRPLVLGRTNSGFVLASETCAFDAIGAKYIRDVRPGEVVVIDEEGLHSYQHPAPLSSSFCIFEFVYFARTDSVLEGIGVYQARKDMGRRLAIEHPVDADMVIGVPDSGTTAAIGYAEESGIPYSEGLIKNRYVGRTFIQPGQANRELAVRMKLNALHQNVNNKRIIMIEDSIVRGTTSKHTVSMLRVAGAREIHMRISSPPVVYPCFFGVDTPSQEYLIGAHNSIEHIGKTIGTDSLGYLSLEGLTKTLEGSNCGFCRGCFNGEYPIPVDPEHAKSVLERR